MGTLNSTCLTEHSSEALTFIPDLRAAWINDAFALHHASNARYLDRNYAGILIIWDRMFGTLVLEDDAEPCRYGITSNLATFNPLRIAFHEWVAIARDVVRARSWRERFWYVFGPPGWSADGSRRTSAVIRREWAERQEG